MQKSPLLSKKYNALTSIVIGAIFPFIASAAFVPGVPVEDALLEGSVTKVDVSIQRLQTAFESYVETFKQTTYGDERHSLRTLLSLNPEAGVAAELYLPGRGTNYIGGGKTYTEEELLAISECETRPITNPQMARPSGGGAWNELIKNEKTDSLKSDYSTVRVSKSTSLTCLMQEIVEQNKLQINLQIHTLLQNYINSALSASLAQRTAGTISKANIDWVKRGNVRTTYDENGLLLSQESYSYAGSNIDDYKRSLAEASVKSMQQKIMKGDDDTDSLNVCSSFKLSAARELQRQAHKNNTDKLDILSEEVGCQLTNKDDPKSGLFEKESDLEKYYNDATIGNGSPLDKYFTLLTQDQNTERGATNKLANAQGRQINNVNSTIDSDYAAGGGFLSGRECDPSDPNCDISNSRVVIPGSLAREITMKSATQQMDAVSNAKTPEDLAAIAKDHYSSSEILSKGLDNYNTDGLIPNQNISKYVGEFLNGIQNGYFDIQKGTADWASGALLQIYDSTMSDANAFEGADSNQELIVEEVPQD